MGDPQGNLVSNGPNIQPGGGGGPLIGGGQQIVQGDYMPMYVQPHAIDPQPAINQMQQQQNSMIGSAGTIPPAMAH